MAAKKTASIDEYIAGFPETTQKMLQQIRATIKAAAPTAEETISYSIPAFNVNDSYLVYMAGYKNHISLYPAPSGDEAFEKEMAAYRSGKGTVQFPLDKPLPLKLIKKILRYRLKENLAKQKSR